MTCVRLVGTTYIELLTCYIVFL